MILPEVDIIGTGSLATNLAPALEQNGFIVNNIYGRSLKSAKVLADSLYQATSVDHLDFSKSKSTIFLLAIADEAIEEISRELVLPDGAIVAHTSGTKNMSVLGYTASPNIGVFYPLQTFSMKKRVDFIEIPILIEGDNRYTEKALSKIAKAMSRTVKLTSSAQRKMIHLAAIFAGSFTNSMVVHANKLMEAAKADLHLLGPLVEETLNKGMIIGPEEAQTGPAASGNLEVLDEHMEMLVKYPEIQETYRLLSQQIINRFDNEE
jgi:predicted short-subunit dehydrogenase-like oxidoreductase (DUF2520 family)